MRLFYHGKDGGPESHVWGFWLIEWKRVFSIVLLRFEDGSRDAYHTHALNAVSWLLSGRLVEHVFGASLEDFGICTYTPSWRPIVTRRNTNHKVVSVGQSWVLSFRGPWAPTWKETDAAGIETEL